LKRVGERDRRWELDEPDPVLAPGDAFGELKGIVRECICYTVVLAVYVHHYRHDVKR
jgi:hypothetical protein